jgi:hypothetical protein
MFSAGVGVPGGSSRRAAHYAGQLGTRRDTLLCTPCCLLYMSSSSASTLYRKTSATERLALVDARLIPQLLQRGTKRRNVRHSRRGPGGLCKGLRKGI